MGLLIEQYFHKVNFGNRLLACFSPVPVLESASWRVLAPSPFWKVLLGVFWRCPCFILRIKDIL